eukprot:11444142-Heterocapsa_arctica.AAC.1
MTNKEDAMIDLGLEDRLAEYRSLSTFAAGAKELVRAWKAFSHTASEKNRLGFSRAWAVFRETLASMQEDTPFPGELAAA